MWPYGPALKLVFGLLEHLSSVQPIIYVMPIDDLVGNAELLKRVLEHYKYRLDNFTGDEEVKPLVSGPVRRYLTFGQLKSSISEALNELSKGKDTENLKLPQYSSLLKDAARQYVRDLERLMEKIGRELPDTKLKELELEIEAVNACLR